MQNLIISGLKNTITMSAGLAMVVIVTGCSNTQTTEEDGLSHFSLSNEFLNAAVLGADTAELFEFETRVSDQRNQEWIFTSMDNDAYRITNRALGNTLSLDVINDGVFESLIMSPSSDVSGQQWQLTPLDNGYCRLTNSFLGAEIALDVVSDSNSPTITMRAVGNFSGQHWSLEQLGFSAEILNGQCVGEAVSQ